jgi:ribonuclease P protein component
MFSKKNRLTKKEDFDQLYKRGYSYNLTNFKAFVLKNNNTNRFSVIVSKKISPLSVSRNKIKRKLRYALLSTQLELPKNIDILLIATNKELLTLKSSKIRAQILILLEKIKSRF